MTSTAQLIPLAPLVLAWSAAAQSVDFEPDNPPGFVPAVGAAVSTQFQAAYGLSFSLSDGQFPVLGDVNVPQGPGTTNEGWRYPNNQPGSGDILAPGEVTDIGDWFLTQVDVNVPVPDLIVDYAQPASAAGADIIDMDDLGSTFEAYTITAYDVGGQVLGTQVLQGNAAGDGRARRFSFAFSTPVISRLVIRYSGTKSAGANVAFDNFTPFEPGAAPYCTAGSSAAGCAAVISASGIASAAAPSGFTLHATGVEGQRDGLFFFGSNGQQANSWGNGTSFQCVVPPVRRAGLMSGGGTAGACDGSFAQDLNALWCPGCPSPQKNPGPGTLVQAQLWYRDPQSTSNQTTSFSQALEFLVGP